MSSTNATSLWIVNELRCGVVLVVLPMPTIIRSSWIWVAIYFDIGSGPIDSILHELLLLSGVKCRGEVLELVLTMGSGLMGSQGRAASHYVRFILIKLSCSLHDITITSVLLIYNFRLIKVRPPRDRIHSCFPIWLLLCKECKGLLDLSADLFVLHVVINVYVVDVILLMVRIG